MQAEVFVRPSTEDVPLARPFFNGRETELLAQVLDSGVLARGDMLGRFEEAFAAAAGARHAVSVVTVPAGLRVLAESAHWAAGDVIAASAFLPRAAGEALQSRGIVLRVLDVDDRRLLPSDDAINDAHGGGAVDVLLVDPLGAAPTTGRAGATTIFDCERQLAMGPGAILVTDDDEQATAWREARRVLGSTMGDLAAAVGMAQLEKLSRVLVLRQMVASEYARLLGDVPGLRVLDATVTGSSSWAMFPVLLDDGIDRDHIVARVRDQGIACEAPELLEDVDDCQPVAARIARSGIQVPCFAQLSPQQQQRVVQAVLVALETA